MNNIARPSTSGLNDGVKFATKVSPASGAFSGFGAGVLLGLFLFISICWLQPCSVEAGICINPSNPEPTSRQPVEFDDSKLSEAQGLEAKRNLREMIQQLENNSDESIKKQIADFRNDDKNSPAEVQSFLREMVGAKNYYRRMIAVRILAGQQDMDNAPSLIYAVSDPDLRIAFEAHQGLRLLSRKIVSMKLSDTTLKNAQRSPGMLERNSPQVAASMKVEFKTMEARWSAWFLGIRPEAELFKLDNPEIGEVSK